MFVQQEIAGEASAHPASGRRRGAFAGKARLLQPFSIDDAARTSSPDRARGAHAVTAPGDPVLVRRVCRRQEGLESALSKFLRTNARRGAATRITAFHQGRARLGSGESPEAAPGWAPRMLSRVAAARAASIKPEPPRSKIDKTLLTLFQSSDGVRSLRDSGRAVSGKLGPSSRRSRCLEPAYYLSHRLCICR